MTGELASVTAAVFWAAASIIFTRLGRENVSPLAMNLLKCVIAVALLFVTLLVLDGRLWPYTLAARETGILAVSGVIGLTFGDTAFFGALTRIGPRRALLLWALAPPITAVLALPVLGEPITVRMVAGIVLTVGGVVWVIMERNPAADADDAIDAVGGSGFSRKELAGIALGVGASACQATGNVLAKLGGAEIAALDISIVRLSFGILGLGAIVGATGRIGEAIRPMKTPRKAWLIFIATFFGTYLGIWLLMVGIRHTYTGIAATLSSTSPVWILPMAYLFQDERITPRAVAGALLAVGGIGVLFVDPSYF